MARARHTRARACIGREVPPPPIVLSQPVVLLPLARLRRPEGPSRTSQTVASTSPATLLTRTPRAEAAAEAASGLQAGAQASETRAESSFDKLVSLLLEAPPLVVASDGEEKADAGEPIAATAVQAAANTGAGRVGIWDSHLRIAEADRLAIPVKRECRREHEKADGVTIAEVESCEGMQWELDPLTAQGTLPVQGPGEGRES